MRSYLLRNCVGHKCRKVLVVFKLNFFQKYRLDFCESGHRQYPSCVKSFLIYIPDFVLCIENLAGRIFLVWIIFSVTIRSSKSQTIVTRISEIYVLFWFIYFDNRAPPGDIFCYLEGFWYFLLCVTASIKDMWYIWNICWKKKCNRSICRIRFLGCAQGVCSL